MGCGAGPDEGRGGLDSECLSLADDASHMSDGKYQGGQTSGQWCDLYSHSAVARGQGAGARQKK